MEPSADEHVVDYAHQKQEIVSYSMHPMLLAMNIHPLKRCLPIFLSHPYCVMFEVTAEEEKTLVATWN